MVDVVAQGIKKTLAYKKQTGNGAPASGAGGQLLRRRTGVFNLTRDTYENDEIVSHQQSTGATAGQKRVAGTLDGLLSPKTYTDFFAAALRKAVVAGASVATLTLTIAAAGGNAGAFTVTRSGGSYLTDGLKIGDVIRLSAGPLNAANLNKNLLVIGLTATIATVRPVNGVALFAESAIAGCTVAVIGKKTWAPTSGHTDDWFTFEEFNSDLVKSTTAINVKTGTMNIGLPATGNSTLGIEFIGLDRVRGDAQVLTAPAAETTTGVVGMVTGVVIVNGVATTVTGFQITIDGGIGQGEPEAGTNVGTDVQRGRIKVSGSFTAKFRNSDLQQVYDDQTTISLLLVLPVDASAASPFITFVIPAVKLFGDAADDGEKEIIRTYPFTAQLNGAGGAGQATEQTIFSHQDSEA